MNSPQRCMLCGILTKEKNKVCLFCARAGYNLSQQKAKQALKQPTERKRLTYTKEELRKEAKQFSVYYGRLELMDTATRLRYDKFVEKCRVYDKETASRRKKK